MKTPVILAAALAAFPRFAGAASFGDSSGDASGVPGEASGFFDGSLIGHLFFGSEFTGVGMVDIASFAVLAFLVLSVLRAARGMPQGRGKSAPPRDEPPRQSLPPRQGPSQTHDPWARLRSRDVPSPPSAPGPGRPNTGASGPDQGSRSQDQHQGASPLPAKSGPGDGTGAGSAPAAGDHYSPAALKLRKDFDLEDFLKGARIMFARLQESFDRRDFEDIALFATADVVEELREQAEQEEEPSRTDILLVKASLISLNVEDGQEVAEVFFDVLLREGKATAPSQVKEVWYFVHPVEGGFWQLDGIRQVD